MKHLLTLLIVTSTLQLTNLTAQTQRSSDVQDAPNLSACEEFSFGNLGFENIQETTHYVVLVQSSGSSSALEYFTVNPGEIIWQKELYAPYVYYHFVFTDDPGTEMKEIRENKSFVYKGRISLSECENKVFTIEY